MYMEAGGLTLFSYVGQGCSKPGLADPGLNSDFSFANLKKGFIFLSFLLQF